jgi:hypothetical protein
MGLRLSVANKSEDFDEDGCLRGTFDVRIEQFGKINNPQPLATVLEFETREGRGKHFSFIFEEIKRVCHVDMFAKHDPSRQVIKVSSKICSMSIRYFGAFKDASLYTFITEYFVFYHS